MLDLEIGWKSDISEVRISTPPSKIPAFGFYDLEEIYSRGYLEISARTALLLHF